MNNTGGKTERLLTKRLQELGWWAHDMKASAAGQPCDVVALKGNDSWLLDSKECRGNHFSFDRVEPNQQTSFAYASSRGVKCGFAICHEGVWKILKWEQYLFLKSKGEKSCKADDLYSLEITISIYE